MQLQIHVVVLIGVVLVNTLQGITNNYINLHKQNVVCWPSGHTPNMHTYISAQHAWLTDTLCCTRLTPKHKAYGVVHQVPVAVITKMYVT